MKILFVTNYYPPYEVGGYEQLCRDVATRLAHRGHTVQILTSDWRVRKDSPEVEPGIQACFASAGASSLASGVATTSTSF